MDEDSIGKIETLLANQIAIMQSVGLLLHHMGHLQTLVDQIPGAELSQKDAVEASDERIGLIEILYARRRATEEVLGIG